MDGLLSSTASNFIFSRCGDTRDSRKYDTFHGKLAVLFINLLGKGLTQEINGDGGSIWWAPGVNRCCSLFAASRVFLNITSFILFQCRLKVNYEIPVRKSINYRIWMAIYFSCHLFTHAYIRKTINKTFIHIIHDEQYLSWHTSKEFLFNWVWDTSCLQ